MIVEWRRVVAASRRRRPRARTTNRRRSPLARSLTVRRVARAHARRTEALYAWVQGGHAATPGYESLHGRGWMESRALEFT